MANISEHEQEKRIDEIRKKEEESFVERVAEKFKIPYVNLAGTGIDTDALIVVSEKDARAASLAPFKLIGKDLYVALKSPNLPETKSVLERLSADYNIQPYMVSTQSLNKAWGRYADVSGSEASLHGILDISPAELERLSGEIKKNEDIAHLIEGVLEKKGPKKTTEMLAIIFAGAIATKSSDVHIESQEDQVRLRFRQDGVLQDLVNFDHASYKQLLSRIKLLAEMKLTQTQNAQDGRFTIGYAGKDIEVRVSVVPSAYGESFVMRILNPDGIKVGVENLGIEHRLYEVLMREIEKPNGMILTTGPTGSGKTTTLYSFMGKVYNPEVKILTIEDPIEYHLDGINQTQVNRAKGYDFLSGLRAALRQDPDIVMVGEIRDPETASIAVNASLTGHLVLSTLHTNSAAGVIPRLIDLGVSPQILSAALSVSLAQRLVRKICQNCKYEQKPTPEEELIIKNILAEADRNGKPLGEYGLSVDQDFRLTRGRGCETCNQTGYKGRMGIFEAIITDEHIEELLNKKPSEQEVRRVAEKQGLLNMREDGVIKIIKGITSFEEVKKVVDLDIRNITKTDEKEPETTKTSPKETPTHSTEEVSEVKTIQNRPQNQKQAINPGAILGSKSMEISLLIDYLQKLEHEQLLHPDANIVDKIHQAEKTILTLLKSGAAETLSDPGFHDTLGGAARELSKVRESQSEDSSAGAAKQLRRIREDIEHHPTVS